MFRVEETEMSVSSNKFYCFRYSGFLIFYGFNGINE